MTFRSRISALACLLLAGCGQRSVEIDQNEWSCTRIGEYRQETIVMAGSAGMPIQERKTGCVQWTRH